MAKSKSLRITQSRSEIGQPRRMRETLRALGLKGHQKSAEQPDNPAIRGMIRKVRHLVTVEEK
ncbi:MAG TPA: 50S ribosomal protein L30 [Gemmatimonadota bacterium]|jgi:large subunit ribosomal protein L30